MYAEFLKTITIYIEALNAADEKVLPEHKEGMTPYLGNIPVILDNCLCGFIVDEIGRVYSFALPTEEDQKWWANRPGASA